MVDIDKLHQVGAGLRKYGALRNGKVISSPRLADHATNRLKTA